MGQVKRFLKDLSIRKSIVLYVAVFALLAVLLSGLTSALCTRGINGIMDQYPFDGERYYLTRADGQRLGEGALIGTGRSLSVQDARRVAVLELLPSLTTPLYWCLCVLAVALLFYRNKLKAPLDELTAASKKIVENDLDFTVAYDSRDEFGQLCGSFERMRATLAANFSEMWRQIEDRQRLNAAFAHDLRTPLTVLKGYDEMLQASADPQTQETAATMGRHLGRMERYIDSMSRLQRLEDRQPEYQSVPLRELAEALRESAEISCRAKGKALRFRADTLSPALPLDRGYVLEVGSNLIGNAARYAAGTVTVALRERERGLLLEVSDDGPGFSSEGLRRAATPYFTEDRAGAEHFGLGLYLCKVLCGQHGGYLKIENAATGARVSAYFESR